MPIDPKGLKTTIKQQKGQEYTPIGRPKQGNGPKARSDHYRGDKKTGKFVF